MKIRLILLSLILLCTTNTTYDQSCITALSNALTNISIDTIGFFQNSGFQLGAMGNYYECRDMDTANYCVVEIDVQVLELGVDTVRNGLCVPRVCNSSTLEDAVHFLYKSGDYVSQVIDAWAKNQSFRYNDTTAEGGISLKGAYCEDVREMGTGAMIMLGVCLGFLGLNVIASFFDCGYKKDGELRDMMGAKLILAFSSYTNASRLSAPVSEKTKVLNGFRTLMMCYVIYGHTTFFYLMTPTDDILYVFTKVIPTFGFQTVTGGFFAVDAFFYLSGFLVAYLLLEEMGRSKSIKWPMLYLHRYLRLTPTYAFVIFFFTYIFTMLGEGPFHFGSDIHPVDEQCQKYWWTNLLYINNIVPWELGNECLGWGWYLSNDMQFFLITPPLLFLYKKRPKISISIMVFLFLASVTTITGLTLHYDFNGWIDSDYSTLIYTKPWARIAPYLFGIGFGIFAHSYPDLKPTKGVRYIGYSLAVFLWLVTIFGTYKSENWGMITKILYYSLSRPAFVTGLGFITLICLYGKGGIFRSILCNDFFTITARLTFSAYLVHPMILLLFYGSSTKDLTWSPYSMITFFISFCVLSYTAAFFLYLLIEKPVMNLEKLITDGIIGNNEPQEQDDQEELKDGLLDFSSSFNN